MFDKVKKFFLKSIRSNMALRADRVRGAVAPISIVCLYTFTDFHLFYGYAHIRTYNFKSNSGSSQPASVAFIKVFW